MVYIKTKTHTTQQQQCASALNSGVLLSSTESRRIFLGVHLCTTARTQKWPDINPWHTEDTSELWGRVISRPGAVGAHAIRHSIIITWTNNARHNFAID